MATFMFLGSLAAVAAGAFFLLVARSDIQFGFGVVLLFQAVILIGIASILRQKRSSRTSIEGRSPPL